MEVVFNEKTGFPEVRFTKEEDMSELSKSKLAILKGWDETFEDEPLGYGAGRIGKKGQREIDVTLSRASDTIMKGVYSAYLVGRYAGAKAHQWGINPNGLIEVDDVDQVRPLPIDVTVVAQALALIADRREEFRSTVGAHTNLQAQLTKASATESAIAQTEAVRGASVHAEIIAETFLREHIETMHYNNLEYLDEPIWVAATGDKGGSYYDRKNLPVNIGVEIKLVTDKDFRPERAINILKGIELGSSIRNVMPEEMNLNFLKTLVVEYFRTLGIDPRKLAVPVPVGDQLAYALKKAESQGKFPALNNEVEGEAASAGAGSGANLQPTPMGLVPTSPLASTAVMQGL